MIETLLADELRDAAAAWRARGGPDVSVMLVAGSGLSVDLGAVAFGPVPVSEVAPFDTLSIAGHALSLEVVGEAPVLYQRGRLHAYQGYSASEVVFTVRLAALLGAHTLVITNASGGIYAGARAGDLALLRDHVNLTGLNPLRGALPPEWGPQFPDMVDAYAPALRARAREIAAGLGVELRECTYAGLLGPSYETPAEIEVLRRIGCDLVGMSTVLEVIAARQMGMRVLGLSLVTNPAAGADDAPLDHVDVLAVSERRRDTITALLASVVADEVVAGNSAA